MVKDEDLDLAATIAAAYIDLGCPHDAAHALTLGGFMLHYQLEEARERLLNNLDRDTILLVLQLEIVHLQRALEHIMGPMPTGPVSGPTIQ